MVGRVGWHSGVLQRFFDAVVPNANLAQLAGLFGGRYFASEGFANADHSLALLAGGFELAVSAPEVVLIADADMLAENHCHRRDGDQSSHAGPEGVDEPLG